MNNELGRLRRARELTQKELAAAVGVSRQTIIAIEQGRFDPSLPLAFRLAALFETSIEAIFHPDDRLEPLSARRVPALE